MAFPSHIAAVLDAYGIRPETKAALYELYLALGAEVLEVFADLAEGVTVASSLEPDDTLAIRQRVIERYIRRNHPLWLEGKPTPSLWHPREAEGRASGAAVPLGDVPELARNAVGVEPLPDGMLILGRNAHFGARLETVSFEFVARDLADAIALGTAAGPQQTIPGSAGQTSGTFDSAREVALIWEVQPNVDEPSTERHGAIAALWRHHRNWPVATFAAAVDWLAAQNAVTFVVRGDALGVVHDAGASKPLSADVAALHDRTVARVAHAAGATLDDPTDTDEIALLDSCVMNEALRRHVLQQGPAHAIWRFSRA